MKPNFFKYVHTFIILLLILLFTLPDCEIKNYILAPILTAWGQYIFLHAYAYAEPMYGDNLTDVNREHNKEEVKEHEDVSRNMASHLDQVNENAYTIMQYSGAAGMYGIEERDQTFSEMRIHYHSDESVNIAQKASPKTSPGQGQFSLMQSQIDSAKVDTNEAIKEDVSQFTYIGSEGVKRSVAEIISGGGTYLNHEDNQNDLP